VTIVGLVSPDPMIARTRQRGYCAIPRRTPSGHAARQGTLYP
jgi:hypothetical protein